MKIKYANAIRARKIAALAEASDVMVAPHNPFPPVARSIGMRPHRNDFIVDQ